MPPYYLPGPPPPPLPPSKSPRELHNRKVMYDALAEHIAILQSTPGQSTIFAPHFPRCRGLVTVNPNTWLFGAAHRYSDFSIEFSDSDGSLNWWIPFEGDVMAHLKISGETLKSLREWGPSPVFILNSLCSSLRTTQHASSLLELCSAPFSAFAGAGANPWHSAQELLLFDVTRTPIGPPVLLRCMTHRCSRVFYPNTYCPKHRPRA
ncbi:hypothetical protein MKEN_00574500 [Mycena kentingensis (nom. inval.)]|nr:hypothetical protein MKEN_00574500 [Mycena kentingensis (nom. inval.)]